MNTQESQTGQFILLIEQKDKGTNGKPFARLLARFNYRQAALKLQKHRNRIGEQVLSLNAAVRRYNLIS